MLDGYKIFDKNVSSLAVKNYFRKSLNLTKITEVEIYATLFDHANIFYQMLGKNTKFKTWYFYPTFHLQTYINID